MPLATAALLSSLVAASCGPDRAEAATAPLARPFGLRIGESAVIDSTALELVVVDVSEDSRCPKGEQCFWEGDATLRVRLGAASADDDGVMLELHTARGREPSASRHGYSVRLLRLDPQPLAGRETAPGDYCAILEVAPGGDSPAELQ